MKNVLVITNMYPSIKNSTYGIFVKEHVEMMRSRGVTVEICSITNPGGSFFSKIIKYLFFFLSIIKKIVNRKINVVHVHYFFPTIIFAVPFLILKKKVIVTFHGGDWDNKIKNNKRRIQFSGFILKYVSGIIVVSPYLKTELIKNFPDLVTKIKVIDMGINFDNFPLKNENYSKKKNVILIGNFIKQKGIEEFIIAASDHRIKDLNFIIIYGKKDESFYENMTKYIEDNKTNNIIILNDLTKKEINQELSNAFCLVVASYNEGFGLVALEGMRTRVPVIYSLVGGLKVLCENVGIPLIPRSHSEIVNGILKLKSMPKENMESKLEKAYLRSEKYDMNKKIDSILAVYNRKQH